MMNIDLFRFLLLLNAMTGGGPRFKEEGALFFDEIRA